ncbi:EAL domain-containing protein [Pseudoroseomonas wenyumeiae]|uniref:EAL domain-containing protein n=1 Tax=Teichococcus wenyumeiae TaxID=2478470 RepID=A0A3A9JDG8_9PROT|nr:EAL domain-containing protein [Pseudoroseomonas wenyumeiae]RKK03451.1 EAL domain-containing protein [Pseudoroseomonas wenyumeiae]RMI27092.1 EAL domain-containing protein [Pseudoroseomonas wenyumeiae]
MPIRLKILVACIALTGVTLLMGSFSQRAQRDLGEVATRLYDDAFLAMNYLRSAESKLVRAEAEYLPAPGADTQAAFAAALADAGADLEVARARAMSAEGEAATQHLAQAMEGLAALLALRERDPALLMDALRQVGRRFETAIEVYAADGFQQRVRAGEIVERTAVRTQWVIAMAVIAALLISALLTRSIVPAVRHAVEVAKAIAAGSLDNNIPPQRRSRSEVAQLLRALDVMQTSIRDALAHIRALMDQQASSHADATAAQHARFEAALSNMVQGLCLFDAEGRLAVANRRFVEMFGQPAIGTTAGALFQETGMAALCPQGGPQDAASTAMLPDGRFIAVARRAVESGGWVTTYEDVTERMRAEARIAHLAKHDALTGLPNRVALREHMQQALPLGPGEQLAVLCLDLDRFKIVNDTLGHPVGDALLRAVSERLLECTRKTDLVVRQGGDEFAIVQRHRGGIEETVALASRVIATLTEIFQVEGHQISIGTSIGIGIAFAGEAIGGIEDLIKSADLALYRAKSEGGSTFRFFEAGMDEEMRFRRHLEVDLRAALAKEELELFYQPLVHVGSGHVSGFEALIRWRHPERGLVSPAVFIPLAEEIGLIKPIGAWVLRRACADAALWPEGVKVAVNLSPVQFRDGSLPGIVAAALQSSGLPAERLELEITESLMLMDDQAVLKILHDLRRLGTRIAMDDFGTGYSSLSYLRRFPFDKIKIDQSFIRGLDEQGDAAAIVRAVISLGQSLGMTVNAEGVETEEQFSTLRAQGCGEVQGYFFSPPRPGGEVQAMMRNLGAKSPATAQPPC